MGEATSLNFAKYRGFSGILFSVWEKSAIFVHSNNSKKKETTLQLKI